MRLEQRFALPPNVVGVGIDICDIQRIASDLQTVPGFAEQFCTPQEMSHCDRGKGRLRPERYSALWSSKEATYKALNEVSRRKNGAGLEDFPLRGQEIAVCHDKSGQPYIQLSGQTAGLAEALGIDSFFLSNSHEKQQAIAISMAYVQLKVYHPLRGKTALITGSTRFNGIGFAIAERFAADGISNLILVGTKTSRGRIPEIKRHFMDTNTNVEVLIGNIAREKDAINIMEAAYKYGGGNVDILVNNAGVNVNQPFNATTLEDWNQVIGVKTQGAFLMTREWFKLRNAKNIKGGKVINIASIIGIYGNNGQAAYDSANGALIAFTKGRALEFGSRGITVNVIVPGFVGGTDMTKDVDQLETIKSATPLNELMSVRDIAAATAFLSGPDAEKITGAVLPVDGGLGGGYTALYGLHKAGFRQIPRHALKIVADLTKDEVAGIIAAREAMKGINV